MPDGTVASRDWMPLATAGSLALTGSNTNARSLRAPSPLMSEPTSGVNGAPELSRPIVVTSSPPVMG